MEKFVPYDKLSKKKKRELDKARRGSWYGVNPVTRKPENSRAYNRRKARTWSDDSLTVPFSRSFSTKVVVLTGGKTAKSVV
jgi:hypothetical protein